jgi:hypothetical protein
MSGNGNGDKYDWRGYWDNRGKFFGSVSAGGGAVQSVLDGISQMSGLMIVSFVAPVTPCRGSGPSATSLRFESLRADLKHQQAQGSQPAKKPAGAKKPADG